MQEQHKGQYKVITMNQLNAQSAMLARSAVAAAALLLTACAPMATQQNLPAPPPVVDNSGATVEAPKQPEVLISQSGAKIKPLVEAPVTREQKSKEKASTGGTWYKSNTASVEQMPVAAKTLVHDASLAISQKDYAQAERLLARAQRMAPKAVPVYYETARLKLAQNAYAQAESLLQRGISVAGGRKAALKDLWTLMAGVRDASGDLMGAQRARLKARRYR